MSLTQPLISLGPPPHGTLPSLVIRPSKVRDEVVESITKVIKNIECAQILLQDDQDWPEFARSLESFFRFPSSIDHSFSALRDWLTDLSWLDNRHYVYIAD